jgi:FixJ family two-component response regulator
MQNKQLIHIVDPSSRNRAELASTAFAIGHHAEVYSDIDELCHRPPRDGILLVRDDVETGGVSALIDDLSARGVWLPVIAMAERVDPDSIVTAMKAGALDYLPMPLDHARLSRSLEALGEEAVEFAKARQKMIEARDRIGKLSNREREVLDWLTRGLSNKAIARELDISPRTVEIHRANMMTKLGASHAADAVRMRIEANVETRIPA